MISPNPYAVSIKGEFILVQSQTVSMVFYDSSICSLYWVLIAIALLLPLLQLRVLALPFWLMVLNLVLVTSAVLISLVTFTATSSASTSLAARGASVSATVPASMDVLSFFNSQALFAFAFAYGTMTLEVMSEMVDYREFPKSVTHIALPVCTALYILSGVWGYSYLGNSASGLLISNIPLGPAYRAAAVCLFLHISVTSTVTGAVLVRGIHRAVHPSSLNNFGMKGKLISLSISIVTVSAAGGMAIAIPIFEFLTSLIGALMMPGLAFLLPLIFVLRARKHRNEWPPSAHYAVAYGAIAIFLAMLTVIGTVGAIMDIVKHWSTSGGSFTNC